MCLNFSVYYQQRKHFFFLPIALCHVHSVQQQNKVINISQVIDSSGDRQMIGNTLAFPIRQRVPADTSYLHLQHCAKVLGTILS